MNFTGNPDYTESYTAQDGTKFYTPKGDYHMTRYLAAQGQAAYSSSGITKKMLSIYLEKIIEIANDDKYKTSRTDIGVLCNNLKYRLEYPIDEHCALRMGCIYHLMDGENPEQYQSHFTTLKEEKAKQDGGLYDFFIREGIKYTPVWTESEIATLTPDYFQKRKEAIDLLTPLGLSNQL